MNTSKTVVFSTSVKGRKQLSRLRVHGVSFKQSHVVKIFGAAAQFGQSDAQRNG